MYPSVKLRGLGVISYPDLSREIWVRDYVGCTQVSSLGGWVYPSVKPRGLGVPKSQA